MLVVLLCLLRISAKNICTGFIATIVIVKSMQLWRYHDEQMLHCIISQLLHHPKQNLISNALEHMASCSNIFITRVQGASFTMMLMKMVSFDQNSEPNASLEEYLWKCKS